jgi:hypothetical protein
MFLGKTFEAESLGNALNSFGGKLSLKPPLGGMILAQDIKKQMAMKEIEKTKIVKGALFIVRLLISANIEFETLQLKMRIEINI